MYMDNTEPEFNLLFEPWISVLTMSGMSDIVSLCDVFKRAPELRSLAGELPAQDTAVLRLLLAVLHSVFNEFTDTFEALDFWEKLWNSGKFPSGKIEQYLKRYEDRFWLFHPTMPFFQVPGLKEREDTFRPDNGVARLNGEISEGDNKVRLFSQRYGREKASLNYAEAVRWLLYYNGFVELLGRFESKIKPKGAPSTGIGWLGQLGLITAVGGNLFQTMMLNFVLLDDKGDLWEKGQPIWAKPVNTRGYQSIPHPANQTELLTLQSRGIWLEHHDGRVTSYRLISGDFFPKEDSFCEQMTTWQETTKGKGTQYRPKPFNPAVQLWRGFASLTGQDGGCPPGIVRWLKYLKSEFKLPVSRLQFQTSGIIYNNQAKVTEVFSDGIYFNAELLSEGDDHSNGWVGRIIAELGTTENLVREIGTLAQMIARASGVKDSKNAKMADGIPARDEAKRQAYYRLDKPFRAWLESIDPREYNTGIMMDDKCEDWWHTSRQIIRDFGRELVSNCSPQAIIGRGGLSVPQAFNWFIYNTTSREALKKKGSTKLGKSVKDTA